MRFSLARRAVLLGMPGLVLASHAQAAWPERPITLVHGFGPGGNADAVARVVADALTHRLGKTVIVDARPGAAGVIATGQIARAAPDGYTLGYLVGAHAIAPAINKSLPYDPLTGFSFIGMAAEYPFVLLTYPDHAVRDLADFVRLARERREPFTYGSAGVGSTQHLAMELFCAQARITMQHVPYRVFTQAALDLAAKRIDFTVEAPSSNLAGMQRGNPRPVAVTSATRFTQLPDVPAMAEAVPGYEVTTWSGIAGPAGLPTEIVTRLNTELRAALTDPAVIQRIIALGNDVAPSTPEFFRDRVARDIEKWAQVVTAADIERM
ncbi:Bug family tripartite tricarboxylate transporter substrate binding protein [Humitalea sp. 24SJ18S-53]|uniref:Bug family tripartite tricarboxylate transporter substrate binding protein n=1 Tax=Humitalea sp. 24SJ18S-53 TaxID=3422307 RepID=UPI003D67D698